MSRSSRRNTAAAVPDAGEPSGSPDLLRVALAACAAHLHARARAGAPRPSTAWGRAARLAQMRGLG